MKRFLLFLNVLVFFFFTACSDDVDDTTTPPVDIGFTNGVFILNEGNFQSGDASIDFLHKADMTISESIFSTANNLPLGDVAQSMTIFDGNAYIVVNNSSKIEVVNAETFVSVATIEGLTSPRYILPVGEQKAYVSDLFSGSISIVNLMTNTVTGSIPLAGWSEEMLLSGGEVFVTSICSEYLYVIDVATDAVTDSVAIGYAANSLELDKNGNLWVLASGDLIPCWGVESQGIFPQLTQLDPFSKTIFQTWTFDNGAPSDLSINGEGDQLYFIHQGIHTMNIDAANLPTAPLIDAENANLYSLEIDPQTENIYSSDASFDQKGAILQYQADGTLLNTFVGGIGTGQFYFAD